VLETAPIPNGWCTGRLKVKWADWRHAHSHLSSILRTTEKMACTKVPQRGTRQLVRRSYHGLTL
jgi:hypothetical protein